MNQRQHETLLLAALLHDLGTLFASDPPAVVRQAEADSDLSQILTRAKGWGTPGGRHTSPLAQSPLVSVFSLLRHHTGEPAPTRYLDFSPLGATDADVQYLFPTDVTKRPRADYLEKFRSQFEFVMRQTSELPFDVRFSHSLCLLHEYARCVPAHSNDLCLYDHLRLTTAIAACLLQVHGDGAQTEKPMVLVVGDLSGIQDYIFDIATIGAAGASRRLRARSFCIGLISDLASHALAHLFELQLANVLMSSGGKFYVLAPNLPDTGARLESFRRDVDTWLYDQYNGEIGLNLASLPLGGRELDASRAGQEGFGAFMSRLNRELDIAKHRRGRAVLQDQAGWIERRFVVATQKADFSGESACRSCRKFPGTERDGLCEQCTQQSRLGSKLTRARAVAFFRDGSREGDDFAFLADYRVRVLAEDDLEELDATPYLVVQLNNPDASKLAKYPAAFRYLANHVPLGDDGTPLAFDEIAQRSAGRDLLGYVKADVDHMGRLFAEGLRDEGDIASHDTAAHLVALSRELDLFFSVWLEHALSQEFMHAYTVFSGGDDLFVLGPWNQSVELARKVNAEFHRFACENPAVTLSAGILYTKSRFPIARAAPDAEAVLEKSKEQGRNRLTVLGDTLSWDGVPTVLQEVMTLGGFSDQDLRSAFLYRLIDYAEMYRRAKQATGSDAIRYKAHFAYTIARNLRGGNPDLLAWADELLQGLFVSEESRSVSDADKEKARRARTTMEHLGLISTTVLFTRRTRRE